MSTRLLIITLVHDTSGEGPLDAYFCGPEDPNLVIRNNIENIQRFNPGATIAIHVNGSFTKFDDSIGDLPGVLVNPKRYPVLHPIVPGQGKVAWSALSSYLSTYKYAVDSGVDFTHALITHSSESFVKSGAADYIGQYEFSGYWWPGVPKNLNATAVWSYYQSVLNKQKVDLFHGLFDPRDPNAIAVGQIEGTWASRALFDRIYAWFDKYFDIDRLNSIPMYWEEVAWPTLCWYLSETKNPGYGICAFFLDEARGHVTLSHPDKVDAVRNNADVRIWAPNQYDPQPKPIVQWKWTDSTNYFTVKRVNRLMSDPVRKYITQLQP